MRILKSIGTALLWLVIAVCLGVGVVPAFLDRVYYHGPKSEHFDGKHFFNPDGDAGPVAEAKVHPPLSVAARLLGFGDPATRWPAHIEITSSKPEARVDGARLVATWVGHATVLVQTEGLNILTDPVWSDTVGPFGIGVRRVAAPGVRFDDLPHIDAIIISHNHYDHLDVPTLQRLEARDHPRIFVGLGNDALLASEGVTATGMDWGQHVRLTPDVEIISARNHHWGGRWGVDRTRALWSAFIIKTPHGNIFFAGDTGPGDMKWPQDAAASGPVRLALIPIGAFRFAPGQMVNGNHIGPMDAVRVFGGLGAAFAIPIHWGTFHLSGEAYDTPPKMLSAFAACAGLSPNAFRAHSIGEPVEVPLLGASAPAPFNDVAIGKCADSPQVRALP